MCEGRMVSSTKYGAVARVGLGLEVELALCREFGGRGTRGFVDDDFEGIIRKSREVRGVGKMYVEVSRELLWNDGD